MVLSRQARLRARTGLASLRASGVLLRFGVEAAVRRAVRNPRALACRCEERTRRRAHARRGAAASGDSAFMRGAHVAAHGLHPGVHAPEIVASGSGAGFPAEANLVARTKTFQAQQRSQPRSLAVAAFVSLLAEDQDRQCFRIGPTYTRFGVAGRQSEMKKREHQLCTIWKALASPLRSDCCRRAC